MSRQWIARAVIVSLVMSAAPTWAQEIPPPAVKFTPSPVIDKVPGCVRPKMVAEGVWPKLSATDQEWWCAYERTVTETNEEWKARVLAPPTEIVNGVEVRAYSHTMQMAGMIMIIGGLASMVNWGKTVDVLGSDYCVDDYSVTAGGCSTSATQKKIAGLVALSGVAVVMIGSRKVAVQPSYTPGAKAGSVTATVAWGGK